MGFEQLSELARNLKRFSEWLRKSQLEISNDQIEEGLKQVAEGEDKTIEGWLIYGAALNEGREMFPKGDNKRFSEWIDRNDLRTRSNGKLPVDPHEMSAAMWAAANPEEFEGWINGKFAKLPLVNGKNPNQRFNAWGV